MKVDVRAAAAADVSWFDAEWQQYMMVLASYCPALREDQGSDGHFPPPPFSDCECFVILADGARVGFALVGPATEPSAVTGALAIDELWISSHMRRRHIASRAIPLVMAQFTAIEWELFVFKDNTASRKMNERVLSDLGVHIHHLGPQPTTHQGCDGLVWHFRL